jgi:uncharacterized metal-binding protein
MTRQEILIIPCSGIGKPYGSVSRDATFAVCDRLMKGEADTVCLGLLVIKDPETVERVRNARVYVVDGCVNECARKSVERVGRKVEGSFKVWKFHQENKDLHPKTVTVLDDDGKELSKRLAEHIVKTIKEGGK